MAKTNIEWTATVRSDGVILTGFTLNPWIGCTKIQPECQKCYAATLDGMRFSRTMGDATSDNPISHWGKGAHRVLTKGPWKDVYKWNKEAKKAGVKLKVFCASLSDIFDEEVSDEWRFRVYEVISRCDHLEFLLLTKRYQKAAVETCYMDEDLLSRIWLGFSMTQKKQHEIATTLRRIAIRKYRPRFTFISYEPALGPVNFEDLHIDRAVADQIIVGGESGPGCRPFDMEWAERTLAYGRNHHVPVFVKQMGGSCVFRRWRFDDTVVDYGEYQRAWFSGKGDDWSEWPEHLQVRQWPDGTFLLPPGPATKPVKATATNWPAPTETASSSSTPGAELAANTSAWPPAAQEA